VDVKEEVKEEPIAIPKPSKSAVIVFDKFIPKLHPFDE